VDEVKVDVDVDAVCVALFVCPCSLLSSFLSNLSISFNIRFCITDWT
jgi:hypothetical protein